VAYPAPQGHHNWTGYQPVAYPQNQKFTQSQSGSSTAAGASNISQSVPQPQQARPIPPQTQLPQGQVKQQGQPSRTQLHLPTQQRGISSVAQASATRLSSHQQSLAKQPPLQQQQSMVAQGPDVPGQVQQEGQAHAFHHSKPVPQVQHPTHQATTELNPQPGSSVTVEQRSQVDYYLKPRQAPQTAAKFIQYEGLRMYQFLLAPCQIS
jgi:hypothetical protein